MVLSQRSAGMRGACNRASCSAGSVKAIRPTFCPAVLTNRQRKHQISPCRFRDASKEEVDVSSPSWRRHFTESDPPDESTGPQGLIQQAKATMRDSKLGLVDFALPALGGLGGFALNDAHDWACKWGDSSDGSTRAATSPYHACTILSEAACPAQAKCPRCCVSALPFQQVWCLQCTLSFSTPVRPAYVSPAVQLVACLLGYNIVRTAVCEFHCVSNVLVCMQLLVWALLLAWQLALCRPTQLSRR